MLLKLTVAYDGTGFRGWARQPGERTVEGTLATALGSLYCSAARSRSPAAPTPACTRSRTSSRVEVSGGPPPERAADALNAVLPKDIAVVEVEQAQPGFHARFSARSRSYRYRIWRAALRSPFEVDRGLLVSPLRSNSDGCRPRPRCRRRARLPRLHPDRHPAPGLPRGVLAARWYDRGRRARVRDHRRLVSPSHGANARRDDARARPRAAPVSSAARRARPRERPHPPAGSTSSRWATTSRQASPPFTARQRGHDRRPPRPGGKGVLAPRRPRGSARRRPRACRPATMPLGWGK